MNEGMRNGKRETVRALLMQFPATFTFPFDPTMRACTSKQSGTCAWGSSVERSAIIANIDLRYCSRVLRVRSCDSNDHSREFHGNETFRAENPKKNIQLIIYNIFVSSP